MATKSPAECRKSNEGGGIRTHDLRIKSPLLYRLSYAFAHEPRRTTAGQAGGRRPPVPARRSHSTLAPIRFQPGRGSKFRSIRMGMPAVPLIVEEMRREPNQWFWALEAITGENPVPPEAAGRIRLITQAWLDLGNQRGLLDS